jgi:hypothetical protein
MMKLPPQRWRQIGHESSIGEMRRRLLVAALLAAFPSTATAAPVSFMDRGGHVRVRNDPFLAAAVLTPAPASAPARPARPARARASSERTVASELTRLDRQRAISAADYRRYAGDWTAALTTARRLGFGSTRGAELEAVIQIMHGIAVAGLLTPSRLPALFQTLERNRQWWTTGTLLNSGDRVEFAGSRLVWEYYPGQGLQLQELGSFGKADAYYTAGRATYPALAQLLSEIIPLAANRGGGLTWEYYFSFDGGSPPWTSAMSQGTALEALTRAYRAFHDPSYLAVARRALPIFGVGPPTGVSVKTRLGSRYLLYSFAPGAAVINGFLQSLIGLYDYARASHDPQAARLFAAGNAEAQAEVPQFDTGAWSLYQAGQEDTLDYHVLVTGFLHELCARTHAAVYCTTAQHFDSYLKAAPALTLLTRRARAGRQFSVSFRLSKYSHVGIVVLSGSQTVFLTSAYFPYGVQSFSVPALGRRGTYTIRLAATDLAGNFNRIVETLQVS